MAKKQRVAVIYGGKSGEHEISLISAASVIRNLDRARFEVTAIGIDKQGQWHQADTRAIEAHLQGGQRSLPAPGQKTEIDFHLAAHAQDNPGFDVIFPVVHGPLCEDGTLQGLLELTEIPYVGCGVLASAVGMDKEVAKRLARDAGLAVVPFITLRANTWGGDSARLSAQILKELDGYPVFVKPSNMGSSVGVHKVKSGRELDAAINDAFRYDTKVLVEKAVDAREIEVAVLEARDPSHPPRTSIAGEITPNTASHEFYSYEAKYLDDEGAGLHIPAKITPAQMKEAQKLAEGAFIALECEGMARVDLFLDRKTGEFYLNEINTIPGFTQISMYPKLWEASGIPYSRLLSELIDLAVARHERKKKLLREFKKATQ